MGARPFRAPHHTISDAGLIGGGMIPRPGEVSLAHNGVLFLDELPEFPRNVLEVMRQPLEDATVCIARAAMSLTFPARFMLVAAMNPCPCGYFNDRSRECHCTPPLSQRYVSKISGPLLDRFAAAGEKIYCNAQMAPKQIRAYCDLTTDCERLLERAMQQQGLSARAHDRILKVSRTVADLEGAPHMSASEEYR